MTHIVYFMLTFFAFQSIETDVDSTCFCEEPTYFPIPEYEKSRLFYFQRSSNKNTLIYALNVDENNKLDENNPVVPYWIRYEEEGQKKALNYIQRTFAYGINSKKLNNNIFELKFVSYDKLSMKLLPHSKLNKYRIIATLDGKNIEVEYIYLQIEGGTFWFPKITCVKIQGKNPQTGESIIHFFKP